LQAGCRRFDSGRFHECRLSRPGGDAALVWRIGEFDPRSRLDGIGAPRSSDYWVNPFCCSTSQGGTLFCERPRWFDSNEQLRRKKVTRVPSDGQTSGFQPDDRCSIHLARSGSCRGCSSRVEHVVAIHEVRFRLPSSALFSVDPFRWCGTSAATRRRRVQFPRGSPRHRGASKLSTPNGSPRPSRRIRAWAF
jgi:hypothetical protein